MRIPFSRLIQHTGLYALGNALVKASGLLLAPLFLDTSLLSQAAFGYFELLMATGQMVMLVAGMGLAQGLLKYLTDPAFEEAWPLLPFSALLATIGLAGLTIGVFWAGAPVLAPFVLGAGAPPEPVRMLGLYVGFKVIGQVPYTLLRTDERVGWYVVATLAEMAILVAGIYYMLAVAGAGLVGVMTAYAGAAVASTVMLSLGVLTRIRFRVRWSLLRPLMRYGAPLVLAGLASRFLNLGDRFLLNWLMDAEVVALYGWAARLGGVINMVFVQSFQLSFSVLGLKALAAGDVSLHRRTFRHYIVWTGWAVLGLSLLSYDLTRWVGDAVYLQADPLVFPVALGFLAFGVHVLVNNVLYARGRTRFIGANVAAAAVLNALLNLVLIPWIGAMGAAVATFVAYTVLAGVAAWVAEREIYVGYPWRVFVLTVGLLVGLYLLAGPTAGWAFWPRLLARSGIIVAYWPLVFVLRLYTWRPPHGPDR